MDVVNFSFEYKADDSSTPGVPVEQRFAFCVIVGGGQVGTMIANQLLDLGWPTQLIEVAVSEDTSHHIKELKNRGVQCTLSGSNFNEKLGRATVILLAIRPSNLEQFTRVEGRHLPKHALLVSCLSGVPVNKLKTSLDCNHIIRTRVFPDRLPLDKGASESPEQAINASLLHTIVNAEDANISLGVLAEVLRKRHINENIIPKRVATGPDFMRTVVGKVVKDRKGLFCQLASILSPQGRSR